jgi:hypothetical protein
MLTMSRRPHLGIFVPLAVVAILVASVVAAGAASASRIAPRQHNGVQGIVTSVNGTSTPAGTTCGVASASGVFTLVGMRHGIVAIDVTVGTTATAFTDAALTTPTFANVCVGSRVIALGTLASGTLTATSVTVIPAQAQGIVASVNGISTPAGTTCGVAGASGTLTLTGGMRRQAVTTVDITGGTTTFRDAALTAPTFANVCVGSRVIALGTLSAGTLTATLVTIVPAQAQGIVTAMTVAGLTATCGSSGDSGTLTLGGMRPMPVFANAPWLVTTVDITGGTTTFTDVALTAPTFANVCVGSRVIALGTLSAGTLTATLVTIVPAQAQGIVTAMTVAGLTATCGSSGDSGTLTLGGMRPIPVFANALGLVTTVDITGGTTTFTDPALTPPSSANFTNVCVGSRVIALGTLSAGTLTATLVTIVPPPPARVEGIVASVNGASTPAGTTCGVANTSGVFTLASTMRQGITSVVVTAGTPATTFTDQAVVSPTTPSFADVCVGSHVMAIGAMSAGTLTATSVTVVPLLNLSGGHRNRRGPGAG